MAPATAGTGFASAWRRFEQEAQATASLRSVHTVELYDFGITSDETFYYVMEYLPGLDLERLVDEHDPLALERTRQWWERNEPRRQELE